MAFCHDTKMPLSDFQIKNAKPKEKRYKLSDGESLILLVYPNGSKLWHYYYEFGGKPKTLSIGKYPRISLLEARDAKHEAQKKLEKGIDPSAQKQKEKVVAEYLANDNFEKMAREWHAHKSARWSKKHAANTLRRLEMHVFPYLGSRVITQISSLEVLAVIQRVEKAGKTHMSRRILQIMDAVFKRAIVTGRLEKNPAAHLSCELLPHEVKHMPTLSEDEIPKFLSRLDTVEKKNLREQSVLALWLLMLTVVRTCELRFSKKSDISFERKEWVLRPEVTKMKREHIVSLSNQAIAVLKRLFELTPHSEWLVPSTQNRVHEVMSENSVNSLIELLGYKGRIVGHGFRALFSTVLNDHGFDSKTVDRQLAHVGKDKVESAYNRAEYKKKRQEMMQWWGDFLDSKRPEERRFCPTGFEVSGSFATALGGGVGLSVEFLYC